MRVLSVAHSQLLCSSHDAHLLLICIKECDPKRQDGKGLTALDVAREQSPPNPPVIDYLSSVVRGGTGYIAGEDEQAAAGIKARRPRAGKAAAPSDARLDPTRLAAARHAAQVQEDQARAKREALELQRAEALARREADRERRDLREALVRRHGAAHPAASGYRAGRLTCEVMQAKIDDRTNADGHVVCVWKTEDFFKVELEIEHLLFSTSAAGSAEPVWREKVVMPVLESSAALDVRILLRTFRGKQIEWELVGSTTIPVASLAKSADAPEKGDWVQLLAKRWASRPDLKPVAALLIKTSYVHVTPDQMTHDDGSSVLQAFQMPQPPTELSQELRPPPGPTTGNDVAVSPAAAAAALGRGPKGLSLQTELDFVSAGQYLLSAGFQEEAVEGLLAVLREAKSLFRGALAISAAASPAGKTSLGHDESAGLEEGSASVPTADLRTYLSVMG